MPLLALSNCNMCGRNLFSLTSKTLQLLLTMSNTVPCQISKPGISFNLCNMSIMTTIPTSLKKKMSLIKIYPEELCQVCRVKTYQVTVSWEVKDVIINIRCSRKTFSYDPKVVVFGSWGIYQNTKRSQTLVLKKKEKKIYKSLMPW